MQREMTKAKSSLTTGELAQQCRVNPETIRYYEREGLLPRPPRSSAGYRLFSADDLRRVRFIRQAQELGFSLREIRELLELRSSSSSTCADVRGRTVTKIAEINRKLQTLEAIRKILLRLTASCSGRGGCGECPILEALDSTKEIPQ